MSGDEPWAGVSRLLVDGNNLLHRTTGGVEAASRRLVLSRLRAALPDSVLATLILDGMPDPGAPHGERIGRNLEVRHAGRLSADTLIVELVAGEPFEARAGIVVVTDDRALGDRARTQGALVRRLDWLQRLLLDADRGITHGPSPGAPRGSTLGHRRPPPAALDHRDGSDDARTDDRQPWRPGRGATRKRGNPRRSPRRGP
jgi:hypothetical protein